MSPRDNNDSTCCGRTPGACPDCPHIIKLSPHLKELLTAPIDSSAHGILLEAAGIVAGARNTTHGDKERSFVAIAADWTAYLASRKDPHGPVRARDVARMMVRLKQQRAEWGTPTRDHAVDAAGYSAIDGELSA